MSNFSNGDQINITDRVLAPHPKNNGQLLPAQIVACGGGPADALVTVRFEDGEVTGASPSALIKV